MPRWFRCGPDTGRGRIEHLLRCDLSLWAPSIHGSFPGPGTELFDLNIRGSTVRLDDPDPVDLRHVKPLDVTRADSMFQPAALEADVEVNRFVEQIAIFQTARHGGMITQKGDLKARISRSTGA